MSQSRTSVSTLALSLAVLGSGIAGLSWEILWQHHAGLALGISAFGTAITLASMMAGLGLGGLLAVRLARSGRLRRPLYAYGVAELVVGLGALAVAPGLEVLASVDTWVYGVSPGLAKGVQIGGIALLLLVPSIAMGATIPILTPYAERSGVRIARIYALNLLGAVVGILGATFFLLPYLGVTRTGLVAAGLNLAVALWGISRRGEAVVEIPAEKPAPWPPRAALGLAWTSGFVIFVLEVSWFRSVRAALQATTESFALILASFLLALSAGGWIAARLERRVPDLLPRLLPFAGLAVLCATPFIDGFDRLVLSWEPSAFTLGVAAQRFTWLLLVVLAPVTLLGTIFPWLLGEQGTATGAGRLYAVNTVGAVLGALVGGFVFLPTLGSTHTSWLAAAMLFAAALLARRDRLALGATALLLPIGFGVAWGLGGPEARQRVQGTWTEVYDEVLYVEEGPDSTVWVAATGDGIRDLVIDGFVASGEDPRADYMRWMGHLPALAARADLGETLVICFGTGQTADAVRRHKPQRVHVVDINRAVLAAAPFFRSNHDVLDDPRVDAVAMDGRAFLRRHPETRYDLVTLEPMPPNFAGSNHLYSREFYELIRDQLSGGGMAAQWLPIHLLSPNHMLGVVATFHEVFPYSRLWLDPVAATGILVGGLEPWEMRPSDVPLDLSDEIISRQFYLGWEEIARLAEDAPRITDDNQLLSYGNERLIKNPSTSGRLRDVNLRLLKMYRRPGPGPAPIDEAE